LNDWSARKHVMLIADSAGHQWTLAPSSSGATQGQADDGVFYRLSYIPNSSRWTMLDPGDPVTSMTNTVRLSGVSQAPSPSDPNKIYKWVPFGAGFTATVAEDAYIRSVSYRTGIITDFDKGIAPVRDEPLHSGQYVPLAAGPNVFAVDDISYACWWGTRSVGEVRFTIGNETGRRGLRDVPLVTAANDGQAWCDDPMGPSPSPLDKPLYHDLFDGFRAWAETDPVDPYRGGFQQDVTDYA